MVLFYQRLRFKISRCQRTVSCGFDCIARLNDLLCTDIENYFCFSFIVFILRIVVKGHGIYSKTYLMRLFNHYKEISHLEFDVLT